MFGLLPFARRCGAMAIAVGLAAIHFPSAAAAQDQDLPSYARPAYASADETIHGRIRSVEGAFTLAVDDDRGFVDSVQLHQGTIINPTGLTLSAGMSVTILGDNAGSVFSANEIDTPYTYDGPLPTPAYYGPGYWYPGFEYGYGPSFSLAIIIGGGSRPWYYEHRPYHGRPWNGHGYFGASIAFAHQAHGFADSRRSYTRPTVRNAGAPPAFAGRSFAGGSHVDPDRFGSQSTSRSTITRSAPAQLRGMNPEARYHGSGAGFGRANASPRGGGERSAGGHSGGGHAH